MTASPAPAPAAAPAAAAAAAVAVAAVAAAPAPAPALATVTTTTMAATTAAPQQRQLGARKAHNSRRTPRCTCCRAPSSTTAPRRSSRFFKSATRPTAVTEAISAGGSSAENSWACPTRWRVCAWVTVAACGGASRGNFRPCMCGSTTLCPIWRLSTTAWRGLLWRTPCTHQRE